MSVRERIFTPWVDTNWFLVKTRRGAQSTLAVCPIVLVKCQEIQCIWKKRECPGIDIYTGGQLTSNSVSEFLTYFVRVEVDHVEKTTRASHERNYCSFR